jgi:hypothetical protein
LWYNQYIGGEEDPPGGERKVLRPMRAFGRRIGRDARETKKGGAYIEINGKPEDEQ